jgi:hypothetical protein
MVSKTRKATEFQPEEFAVAIDMRAQGVTERIVAECQQANTWLSTALRRADHKGLRALRNVAENVSESCTEWDLPNARLAVQETLRRIDRTVGLMIRSGQSGADQWIRGIGSATRGRNATGLLSPITVAGVAQRSCLHLIYRLTDDVPEQKFERALTEARAEANLSREHVVRKLHGEVASPRVARRARIAQMIVTGHTSEQIAEQIGMTPRGVRTITHRAGLVNPADEALDHTKPLDLGPDGVVANVVVSLQAAITGLGLVEVEAMQPPELRTFAARLFGFGREINAHAAHIADAAGITTSPARHTAPDTDTEDENDDDSDIA